MCSTKSTALSFIGPRLSPVLGSVLFGSRPSCIPTPRNMTSSIFHTFVSNFLIRTFAVHLIIHLVDAKEVLLIKEENKFLQQQ